MIPEELLEKWAEYQSRAELLFLADHGGGFPDCLSEQKLTPAGRRVILCRLGFRVSEAYEMPGDAWDQLESWVRLTNGIAINLGDGFVVGPDSGRRRHK